MRNYLILILLTAALLLNSCKGYQPGPKDSEDLIITRIADIYLLDKNTNENLIGKVNKKYNSDSVEAFRLFRNQKERIGGVSFDSINKERIKIFYEVSFATAKTDINYYTINADVFIYLNKDDTDTLVIKKEVNRYIKFYYNTIFLDSIPPLDENVKVFRLTK